MTAVGYSVHLGRVLINRGWLSVDQCPLCPNSGHRALFDHLVGTGEQLRMNFEAKRLGGLEVFVGKGRGL